MAQSRRGLVTVTYNSGAELGPFLASLRAASSEPLDVVVVDNESSDRSVVEAIAHDHGVRFLDAGGNRGYGAAINRGIARLGPDVDVVLISNPDVILGAGAIDVLVAELVSRSDIGAVGPRIREVSGEVYPSARALPGIGVGTGHALFARVWPQNPWTRRYHNDPAGLDEAVDVGWLSGACILVRRSVFDAIGGFDERYFMYFEDVDLGRRLAAAGFRNRYVPEAEVTHIGGRSTAGSARSMVAEHHRSAIRFVGSLYPHWYQFPIRLALGLGLRVRSRWTTRPPREAPR